MTQVELVLDCRNTLGEGPMWSVAEQALYWVDILGKSVHRLDPATGAHEQHDVGQPVGAILLRARGGFALALRDGLYTWQPGETPQLIIDPEAGRPANRFNDAAVDRQGRVWAGTMADGSEPVGSLYRLDADRSLHSMATDIYVSNGLGWSPDNSIMYYCDSGTGSIRAWDFDAQSGGLSNERPFVSAEPGGGAPDGLTVDSEGCVWSARWGGWKVVRHDPQGRVISELKLPVSCVSSVMFGGPRLDELYITTARTDMAQHGGEQEQAGSLFCARPGVSGLPEAAWGG